MAVFPTPGGPTRIGLFDRRRAKTSSKRSISASRPITSSMRPSEAISVRLRPSLASVGYIRASRLNGEDEGTMISSSSTGAPLRGASMIVSSEIVSGGSTRSSMSGAGSAGGRAEGRAGFAEGGDEADADGRMCVELAGAADCSAGWSAPWTASCTRFEPAPISSKLRWAALRVSRAIANKRCAGST